jgi:[pyruvate, water dikinase]-phosphate phosphotransferase / [pyruvate, water dikinase] kinase
LKKKIQVFIVSDATGLTAEMVISAVLLQFREIEAVFKKFPYIKTKEQIRAILDQVQAVQGIVIYSLVSQDLRLWIRKEIRKLNLFAVDILGPHLERIGKMWNLNPTFIPGRRRRVSEESIMLAESIDFTLRHDDGQGIDTIEDADIVLFGVSRTSKTPTSLYLSCNYTLKVANIPIIDGINPPNKIFALNTQKVGLSIAPERLAFIRERRMKYAGDSDYLDIFHIQKELEYSHRIFGKLKGIQILDVTHSSIEEVANKIIEARQERG